MTSLRDDISSMLLKKMSEDKHKDKIYKLIWIQNLDMISHQFRVLFQHAKPHGQFLNASVDPSWLFAYAPGAYYVNGQRLDYPPEEEKYYHITFDSLEKNQIMEVNKVFSDELYELRFDAADYSKNQYCVVIETETQII